METIKNWILLRGLARDSRHWGSFTEDFKKAFSLSDDRLVTLDLPGFGSRPNYEAALSVTDMAEDIRSQWIGKKSNADGAWGCVSMSLGSMCVLEWARLFPGDLGALVTINASASDLSKVWDRFSFRQLARAVRIMFATDPALRESEIYRLTSNGTLAEEKGSEWGSFAPERKDFLNRGLRQLIAAARYKSPVSMSVPLLVLTSKADDFVDFKCSEALAQKYHGELRVHLHAGHDIPLDDADWVISQIKDWARR